MCLGGSGAESCMYFYLARLLHLQGSWWWTRTARVRRPVLSRRKTDVKQQTAECAGVHIMALLSHCRSSFLTYGSQGSHLERHDYASEIVLTAVNRLCRAKLPVSQRAEFCKQLSVSSSSLRTLTYSCCRDYSSYIHLCYLANANVDLASDRQRTLVECTFRSLCLWFSCWWLSHHLGKTTSCSLLKRSFSPRDGIHEIGFFQVLASHSPA